MANRQEMRSYVCAQCHVEYYFKGENKVVTYPWDNGLTMEGAEQYYDDAGFKDWEHKLTGTPSLKAQHPEFELWSQGIHAASGVDIRLLIRSIFHCRQRKRCCLASGSRLIAASMDAVLSNSNDSGSFLDSSLQ